MKKARLLLVCALAFSVATPLLRAQDLDNQDPALEKVLWDVDQQWLCSGPYAKPYKDCVEFRSKYWADQFFEVISTGELLHKDEMVATQSSRIPSNVPGTGPYPDAFRLRAVYGDFAIGTDHTNFKVADKTGRVVFANNAKVLRLFVKVNGVWRPAAAGLVPIIPPARPSPRSIHLDKPRKSPDAQLEKQLAEIDRTWLDSAMNKRLDYVRNLFADRWFEILGWNPTGNTIKATTLENLARAERKPGEGVVPDQFRLEAVYGNVALATDRRTRTDMDAGGKPMRTPHRSILVFVKQNGEWKSAAASLTPIMEP